MDFSEQGFLGQTGLKVGRLGVASSYGAPADAFEEAFERGCNYFYWGSMRKSGMRDAIRNICRQGKRDDLIIVIQSYSRSAFLMETFFKKALNALNIGHADVLLLGWYNKPPAKRLMAKAQEMKQRGLFRFLALSGHNRSLFPQLAEEGAFDLFHIRYNAAHRGAEKEIFEHLTEAGKPSIVTYTATRWGQLLNPKKMPPGQSPPSASDCYRFVLSQGSVDVCICGPKDVHQMREALRTLELAPLTQGEIENIRKIGDYVHENTGKFY